MSAIDIRNVTKAYGPTLVLDNISLKAEANEFIAFLGPSGCGKSTLLRMIAGLETLDTGEIHIGGRRIDEREPGARGVAMVFQHYALYPHMSIRDNMSFGLKNIRMNKAEIDRRVVEAARILEIESFLDKKPGQLSGGQKQRVAIGRAIVKNPDIFLFDEPLSNLDASLRGSMRLEIMKLHQQLKATMIYVTHDQVEAMTMADRIVVLNQGRIEQVGTPQELYARPTNLFVAEFIGAPRMNRIEGEVASAHGAATIGVRPEHLRIVEGDGAWPGCVELIEHLGAETHVHVRSEAAGALVVRMAGSPTVKVGDKIGISPEVGQIHRFDNKGQALR